MLPHQLWSHVGWRSAEDLELLRIGAKCRKSKVDDLDHVRFILYQNIVQLDITVSDSSRVQEIERFCDLPEELTTNRLFDLSVGALLLHVLMQRNALNIICHDANLL